MHRLMRRWIPPPQIVHLYPSVQFAIMTQGRSPVRHKVRSRRSTVSVGGAHFHILQRNRIVVAEDPPAIQLRYR